VYILGFLRRVLVAFSGLGGNQFLSTSQHPLQSKPRPYSFFIGKQTVGN
jgi:hypothetical protein